MEKSALTRYAKELLSAARAVTAERAALANQAPKFVNPKMVSPTRPTALSQMRPNALSPMRPNALSPTRPNAVSPAQKRFDTLNNVEKLAYSLGLLKQATTERADPLTAAMWGFTPVVGAAPYLDGKTSLPYLKQLAFLGAGISGGATIGGVGLGSLNPFMAPGGVVLGGLAGGVLAPPIFSAWEASHANKKRWKRMNPLERVIDRIKYKEYDKIFSKEAASPKLPGPPAVNQGSAVAAHNQPQPIVQPPTPPPPMNTSRVSPAKDPYPDVSKYPVNRLEDQYGNAITPMPGGVGWQQKFIDSTIGRGLGALTGTSAPNGFAGKAAPVQTLTYPDPNKEIRDAQAYYEKHIRPFTRTADQNAEAAMPFIERQHAPGADQSPAAYYNESLKANPWKTYPSWDYNNWYKPVPIYQGEDQSGHLKGTMTSGPLFPWGRAGSWDAHIQLPTRNPEWYSRDLMDSLTANKMFDLSKNPTFNQQQDTAYKYYRRYVLPHELRHAAQQDSSNLMTYGAHPADQAHRFVTDHFGRHGLSIPEQVQFLGGQQEMRGKLGLGRITSPQAAKQWLQDSVNAASPENLYGKPLDPSKQNNLYKKYPVENIDPLRGIRWLKALKQEAPADYYNNYIQWLSDIMPATAQNTAAPAPYGYAG